MRTQTEPRPSFKKGEKDPAQLAAGRYGTPEMCKIWGPVQTFDYILKAQAVAAETISEMAPSLVSPTVAQEILEKASTKVVDPNRIRELEDKTGHDVIAINTALEEMLSDEAKSAVHMGKTSADATQPGKALQLKAALEVTAQSVENVRDILLEKAELWSDIPHMDTSHRYDALPTVLGRPLVHFAEMLQSGLEEIKFRHKHSILIKWADATGNHHSAQALGLDGIELQRRYAEKLGGLPYMDAPAQVPGLEFEADVVYSLARVAQTMGNIARYFAEGRGNDQLIFRNGDPSKKKGSSAMPHKNFHKGNPTAEEQMMSVANELTGTLVTSMGNTRMSYARDLSASSNMRLGFDNGFKYLDHATRGLAKILYWIDAIPENAEARVMRTYGTPTSQRVMNYLVDPSKVETPLPRSEAHELAAELAQRAWDTKTEFAEVLASDDRVRAIMDEETIRSIADPRTYIGESKRVIETVYEKFHGVKTFPTLL